MRLRVRGRAMSATTLIDRAPIGAVRTDGKVALVGLGRDEISAELARIGVEPKKIRMRTKQIFHWIYNYGVTSTERVNISSVCRRA